MLSLPSTNEITPINSNVITQEYLVFFNLLVELINKRITDTAFIFPILTEDEIKKASNFLDGSVFINSQTNTLNFVYKGAIKSIEFK